MKETNPIQQQDNIKIFNQREVEKQSKFIGSVRMHPGHTMFEVNKVTGDILPAEYTSEAVFGKGIKKKIMVKENCHYLPALNTANAMKKWLKLIGIKMPKFKK